MNEPPEPRKRKRLSRRGFLIIVGVGAAGLYAGVKLGIPPLRLRLAEWLEESGGPPTNFDAPPDAWFEILPDNTVKLYLPKSELGEVVLFNDCFAHFYGTDIKRDRMEYLHHTG